MIVCKFGGTSCADAVQIKKAAGIMKADPERRYMVVSAPGKRYDGDKKVTDLLYELYDHQEKRILDQIEERFRNIVDGLEVSFDLDAEIQQIWRNLKAGYSRDYCISRGEYLNAKIIAAYAGWLFVDSQDCFFFDDKRNLLTGISCRFLKQKLQNMEHAVLPGFYGSDEYGSVVTFPRGGSDITGSVTARAVGADLYENWTDVDGILAADPRIVDNPVRINTITYEELRELSYMGASVLQEDAVFPVRSAGIPIFIRNTNAPEHAGTLIVAEKRKNKAYPVITGIAGKKGFSNIQIEKAMMNSEVGFGAEVLHILADYNVSYEHTPTSIDTMSVLVPGDELNRKREQILREMTVKLSPDRLFVEDGIALVAVVGRGIAGRKGFAARLLQVISDADINIRMIDVGFSEMNVIVGVDEENYEKTIRTVYAQMNDLFTVSSK